MRVWRGGIVDLWLHFSRESTSFERLRTLIGSGVSTDAPQVRFGVLVPFKWTVTDALTGALTSGGETELRGSNSWSAADAGRLVCSFPIQPGRYRICAKIVRAVPEFSGISTYISLVRAK